MARRGVALLVLGLLVAGGVGVVVVSGLAGGPETLAAGEYTIDGRIYGLREAEVFHEDYAGPPVVGDAVTMAPDVAPLAAGNRTHEVRIDVVNREIEIAPGVRYGAWTFGGSVPGPIVHVREGDRVNFTMKNRSGEAVPIREPGPGASPFLASLTARDIHRGSPLVMPMPHSIDFHAGTVAPNDKWRLIQPGESIRFQWVANYPGVFTYHCGGAPVLQHVAMGQYGIVIVSPKNGYPTDKEIDREYAVVQSEFYLKPNDEDPEGLWVFDMDAAQRKAPSQVLFNGSTRALTEPGLLANAGERVRLYVHNVGPNDQSSLHIIGVIFDRVFFEANPKNDLSGLQTALLGASNGAVLEFIVPEEGDYILVDHEFADVMKGALGRISARSVTGASTKPVTPMKH
jgi:nitrite reductase (NO-forming)